MKKRIIIVAIIALLINYAWEMLQMPFYQDMPWSTFKSWTMCFQAAIGDMNIILLIFYGGRLLFKSWGWIKPITWQKTVYLLIAGGIPATLIEYHAHINSRWEYSEVMPILPGTVVGIVPFIQLIILPIISFEIAEWIVSRRDKLNNS